MSLHVALRRAEIMKIGERCTVGCPTCGGFVPKPLDDNWTLH